MIFSEKITEILKKLTIEEKAALLSGKSVWESRDIPRLHIPSAVCSDGPNGVRRQAGEGDHLGLNASLPATCYPTAATVANSWNEELAEEIGKALGAEAKIQGVDFLLGPGLNIKRNPLCGRNFEYFSEDPYLSGKMAAAYVKGIQSNGIGACPKHFAVNSQEMKRMATNSVLDERTLREIYLTGFEIAVKEGRAKSIMSSYNEINGVYANENKHLLQDILRKEWGFDGIVITDWGASNDHTAGVAAGSNLEMPCPGYDSAISLIKSCQEGTISMEEIDTCAGELLQTILEIKETHTTVKKPEEKIDVEKGHRIARKAAQESIVLLKNEGGILPLPKEIKVAVIGDFARQARYQGAGSSCVNATKVENVCDLIKEYPVKYDGFAEGYCRNGKRDEKLEEEALELAKKADVVLFFFGLDEASESEGCDRVHMRIPENQIALLENLRQQNTAVIGILSGGASIEMPWENCCQAILYTGLSGQAGAGAALDAIFGRINPSGKLNETFPMKYEDTPSFHYFPAYGRDAQYREGLYVGYRYFETANIKVRYPFGYGLSYTRFKYSDLTVSKDGVSFSLKNVGDRDGAEVAQMYIGFKDGKVFRPAKELKGFAKVFLKAGESVQVSIGFDDKTFRYWNVATGKWETESGRYQIMIGASCEDIQLNGTLDIKGTDAVLPYSASQVSLYYTGQIQQVPEEEFAVLMGGNIPAQKQGELLTVNDAICDMSRAKSALARLVCQILKSMKERSEAKGKPDLNILFIYNMPFRGIAKMTNGTVSMEMTYGMVDMVNGHFFRGLRQIITGYFANARANKEFEKKLSEK